MGGSSSGTTSTQTSTVTTTNRNLQNLDRTNIVEAGGSLNITDGGAVSAGFNFGGKALDRSFNFGGKALDRSFNFGGKSLDFGRKSLSTVEKIALSAIKSSQTSQDSSLKALDSLSRGDATKTAEIMSNNMTKSAALIAGAFLISKVVGGK